MANPTVFVSSNHASGATTHAVTVTADTGDGDTLVVGVLGTTSGSDPSGITDTQGNTWTLRSSESAVSPHLFVFDCQEALPLANGVDVLTVTYAGTGSALDIIGVDVPNLPIGADISVVNTGTGTVISKATGAMSEPSETVLAFESHANGGGTPSWAGVMTSLGNQHNGTSGYISVAYDIPSATTSITPTANITSAAWNMVVVSYEPAPVMVTGSLSGAVQGMAYSQSLAASGGSGTYSWAVSSGSLPAGLSLSGGVVSGTPTAAAGNYDFVITATDTVGGGTGSLEQVVTVTVLGTTASNTRLYGNHLSKADSGLASTGMTWTAESNANTPFVTTHNGLDGGHCIAWTVVDSDDTSIHTAKYFAVEENEGHIFSGFIFSAGGDAVQIGVEWFNSGGSQIGSTVFSDATAASGQNMWQPVNIATTAPTGADSFRVVAKVTDANAGDLECIDLFYTTKAEAQVLVDWVNDALVTTPLAPNSAGNSFMDVSPWVRLDQVISLNRGRQDSISEVGAGSASFTLQNDTGVFTPFKASSLVTVSGGTLTLQRRCQVNLVDELGVYHTRFDGPITEADYVGDNTGNTNQITVAAADVLAPLSRADNLSCWTRETVRADGPLYTWALDDNGNTGAFGQGAESSGNNGPPLRTFNKDQSGFASIAWADESGGVETLADAVALTMPDGSEYWSAGSNVPSSSIRGLDSGTVGPYTTPIGSAFLTPVFSTQTDHNTFIGNSGFCFFTELGAANLFSPNADGEDFSLECWFTMDTSGTVQESPLSLISGTPSVAMTAAADIGPYVQLSMGSARQLTNVVSGLYFNTTTHMTYKLANYSQPPAFAQNTWGSTSLLTPLSQVNTPFVPDRVATTNGNNVVIAGGSLPHHLVITCAGAVGGGSMTLWLDGVNIGSIHLVAGQVFDTLYVGSAFGGQGAHFGNISIVSIYGRQLSASQIIDHCSKGQYGMWEQTTDNCIAQLGKYASIPSFWSNLQANNTGLSMTDYQDITGSNALTSMQLYEQAEQGLLFVNNAGQLAYHTRDWRMGYGAPDMLLPPDTYDANMSLQQTDQFQINQAGFSTQTYQSGSGFVNQESRDTYGAYTFSSSTEPTEVPLISFSRVYSLLGLPNLAQWPDPHLEDAAGWLCNTRPEPWYFPGQLTVDITAVDTAAGCPNISDWYALDIDNVIAPSGDQPASWQDVNVSNEWFIEGINETISDQQRQLTIFTSPAENQRAWKMGDATYGVLGVTSRIGISAPDLNVVYVGAKDVSHDAGPPYVPPSITAMTDGTLNNPAGDGHGFLGGMDMRGLWQNMSQVIEPPMLIVGASFNAQTIALGATSAPELIWDTIYADTANGMGIIAGWPNWYVVTVPGFYEIDASIVGSLSSSGDSGSGIGGWICVAEEAAQGIASGLSTPLTNSLYMCPIGERRSLNDNNDNTVMSPTTTLYLGVGDMITVCCQCSKSKNLAFSNFGGSSLSLRWISNSVYADKCRANNSIANGGSITDAEAFVPQTSTWKNAGSVSYLGGGAKPQGSIRQHTNTLIKQGEKTNQDRITGSQYGAFAMPHSSISSTLTGNTLISASLTMSCTSTFNGEQDLMLGWTSATAVGSYSYKFNNSGDNPDLFTVAFRQGQTLTFSIPTSLVTPFLAGTPALAYTFGNNSTKELIYLGEWDGTPNAITLSVVYLP